MRISKWKHFETSNSKQLSKFDKRCECATQKWLSLKEKWNEWNKEGRWEIAERKRIGRGKKFVVESRNDFCREECVRKADFGVWIGIKVCLLSKLWSLMGLRAFGLDAGDENSADYYWGTFVFIAVNEVSSHLCHSRRIGHCCVIQNLRESSKKFWIEI